MDFDLVEAYDFDLPDELVAAEPAAERPQSRLLVADPVTGSLRHHHFGDLVELLAPGDLLVFNDARVVPARLHARKESGGAVELFVTDVVSPGGPRRWSAPPADGALTLRCMTKSSKKLRAGATLALADGSAAHLIDWEAGTGTVRVQTTQCAAAFLEAHGEIPLPPYIVKRRRELGRADLDDADAARYQTVYAQTPGAVAAPTAGLHFDRDLLARLAQRGVESAHVTLYVGPGTFRPVTAERLSEHAMHSEEYDIPEGLGAAVRRCRERGGRVVAVGTTAVRTLEAEGRREEPLSPGRRSTDIFLKPGEPFRIVDAMITNFHLPRSTLLALVYAFGGADFVRDAYATAIEARYRFYSYGDSMFLVRRA